MKKNIAVLASGKGSNAKNICAFFQKSEIVSVKLICSNKKNSPLAYFSNEMFKIWSAEKSDENKKTNWNFG